MCYTGIIPIWDDKTIIMPILQIIKLGLSCKKHREEKSGF